MKFDILFMRGIIMRGSNRPRRFFKFITSIICLIVVAYSLQMFSLFRKTSSDLFDIENQSLEEILDEAKEIKIQRKIFSFRKHYYVSVDNVVVGEVRGRFFTPFGDKLELLDSKGNVIKSEYQIKRLGPTYGNLFNISLDRLAEVSDSNGNVTGYIGEEKLSDFWKLNRRQYFYDETGRKIGSGKQKFFMFCKDYTITNSKGDKVYDIDGNIFSLTSKFNITKVNNENIDEEDVIFYTIIENSILDNKSKESSSNNSKNK